ADVRISCALLSGRIIPLQFILIAVEYRCYCDAVMREGMPPPFLNPLVHVNQLLGNALIRRGAAKMIVIVDDRNLVTDAFRSSFDREGIPAAGFSGGDFEGWVASAANEDVMAINAFLIGQCGRPEILARIIKRRSAAA